MGKSIINLVTSKYGRIICILAWIIAPISLFVFSPSLTDVSSSRQQDFLPVGAESTEAIKISEEHFPSNGIPGILVYKREGGLTNQDLAAIHIDFRWLESQIDQRLLGNVNSIFNNPGARDSLMSPDESTLMTYFSITTGEESASGMDVEQIQKAVREIRDHLVASRTDGIQVWLTGPAGTLEDAVSVFQSIDMRITIVTVLLVLTILLIIYRAPLLAILPLISAGLSYFAVTGIVSILAERLGLVVTAQATSIMIVLIFGAGTDYMLFISSRFKEQLNLGMNVKDSIAETMTKISPAILSSALTTILAMLALSFATLRSFQVLGPILALGMSFAIISGLTFIPAILSLLGKLAFWPRSTSSNSRGETAAGFWYRVADLVDRKPLFIVVTSVVALLFMSTGVLTMKPSFNLRDSLPDNTESVQGYLTIQKSFPSGSISPTNVFVVLEETAIDHLGIIESITGTLSSIPGISSVTSPSRPFGNRIELEVEEYADHLRHISSSDPNPNTQVSERMNITPTFGELPNENYLFESYLAAERLMSNSGRIVRLDVVFQDDPGSLESLEKIKSIRQALDQFNSYPIREIVVGGDTAIQYDTKSANNRDIKTIAPIVLIIIFVILVILLKAILAPLYLLASVVLSFFGSLGISVIFFQFILGHSGVGSGVPIFMFIFLVALGVDYNIYIISRVKEEAETHGIRNGTKRAITSTGGVITSAGIILAGTFTALTILPLRDLFQLGFVVALGVVIDTFFIRGFMVPSFVMLLGRWNWWPFLSDKTSD
jgi:RND superfamily putative drug exporter